MADDPELHNPLRVFAFTLAVVLVFMRFSYMQDVQTVLMGFSLKLLYVFGIPAMIGVVLAGGIQRSFRSGRTILYWVAFVAWMAAACVFSTWRGGSVNDTLLPYLRTDLVMMFAVAGLAVTWRECRIMIIAVAWAAAAIVLSARLFAADQYGYRASLEFGTISNPNDLAGHLLLVLPFLLWVVLASKKIVLRLAALGLIGYGLKVVIATASRGALVGLAAQVLFFLWRANASQRMALLLAAPVLAVAIVAVTPAQTLNRLGSLSSSNGTAEAAEAAESADSRIYVFKKSLEYMIKFPILGVGPGQFATYEGTHSIVIGTHGSWHEAHNSYTQVGSDCGIPGLLFYLAGIISSVRLLNKTYRQSKSRADSRDIELVTFCVMLGMVGFLVAIAFLNFEYFFYLPTLGGLAVTIAATTKLEFSRRDALLSAATHPSPR